MRRRAALALALALPAAAAFAALGTWQLDRRAWKLALIERVEQRVHQAPAPAPGPAEWPQVSAERDEYRRIVVAGRYEHERETLVQAATELGAGWWVLTPLRAADGSAVLVNRGFVPPERRERAQRAGADPQGIVEVVGLLRLSEPGGAFLRANDPTAGRWTSRDVAAIAHSQGLGERVAPYFVDAESGREPGPVGGLTVIAFRNNHLVYALTWYVLAAMALAGAALAIRTDP